MKIIFRKFYLANRCEWKTEHKILDPSNWFHDNSINWSLNVSVVKNQFLFQRPSANAIKQINRIFRMFGRSCIPIAFTRKATTTSEGAVAPPAIGYVNQDWHMCRFEIIQIVINRTVFSRNTNVYTFSMSSDIRYIDAIVAFWIVAILVWALHVMR